MQFNVASKHAFDFPLSQVSNATIGAKHEVAVEFAPPPPSDPNVPQRGGQDHLVEIRFYVPGSVTQGQITELDDGKITFRDKSEIDAVSVDQTNEEGEISLAAQKVVNGPDGEPIAASTVFFDTLKSRTDLGRSASEAIVDFEELLCLTPRSVPLTSEAVTKWACTQISCDSVAKLTIIRFCILRSSVYSLFRVRTNFTGSLLSGWTPHSVKARHDIPILYFNLKKKMRWNWN